MHRLYNLIVIVLATVIPCFARTPGVATQPETPLTCAILVDKASGLADSSFLPLVEAKLSQQRPFALLERNRIEELLKEQELQSALGADAAGKRVALGRLLKADMLVIFTRAKQGKTSLVRAAPI